MKKLICIIMALSIVACFIGCTPSWKGSFDEETLESNEWEHIGINKLFPEEEINIKLNFDNGKYTWYSTYKNTKTGKSGVKENNKGTYTINGNSIDLGSGTTLTFDRNENDMVILRWGSRYFEQTYKD